MKPTLLAPAYSRISYLLLVVFILATALSAFTYWQFAQLTGSVLVFGQGVLHLIVGMMLVLIWMRPARKWQFLAQLLNSVLVFLLCGLLISESYIRWQEGGAVLTSAALLTTLLGFGALLLLCHLLYRLSDEPNDASTRRIFRFMVPTVSGALCLVTLITHLTGWFWLDVLVAFLTATVMGIVSLFFLLDSYWNIMDMKA